MKSSKQRSRDRRRGSAAPRDRTRPARRSGSAPARGSGARRRRAAAGLRDSACSGPRRRARAARRASRSVAIRSRAPFSPMPGTPLMLSIESPISASTSTTCVGRDAELLLHALGVVPGAIVARVVDGDAVVHELEEVLVAGDDRDLEAGRHRLRRQRADHVVGLVASRGDDRHAERLAGFVDPGDLLGEIRRHRRAVGLVVGDELVAERRSRQIERGGDELRMMVLDQLAQHRHEDVDGVRGLAFGAAEAAAAHRVIGAVHLRTAVDQEQALGRGHLVGGGRKSRERKQYIIRRMVSVDAPRPARAPRAKWPAAIAILLLAGAAFWFRSSLTDVFGKQYEYEEDLTIALDGSATLTVNASIPALVALRGLDRRSGRGDGRPRSRSRALRFADLARGQRAAAVARDAAASSSRSTSRSPTSGASTSLHRWRGRGTS